MNHLSTTFLNGHRADKWSAKQTLTFLVLASLLLWALIIAFLVG